MALNEKIFSIKINGIDQSIRQVESLLSMLRSLETRIDALSKKNITIGVSGNASAGKNTISALNTQNDILRDIAKVEQQINKREDERYHSLVAEKEMLGELNRQAQLRASNERLAVNDYSNTISGMRQQMQDLQTVLNSTDIGSDQFTQLSQRLSELKGKVREAEQAFNTLSPAMRYAGDSAKNINVQVGNTVRTFSSVRQASRELSQELKAMVINGQENTQEFKDLSKAVHDFEMASLRADSAVNDLKKSSLGMDEAIDTFQGLAAIGSIGSGLQALFGNDQDLAETIKKMGSMLLILQGIETVNKQMATNEGVGKWFNKINTGFDNLSKKLPILDKLNNLFYGAEAHNAPLIKQMADYRKVIDEVSVKVAEAQSRMQGLFNQQQQIWDYATSQGRSMLDPAEQQEYDRLEQGIRNVRNELQHLQAQSNAATQNITRLGASLRTTNVAVKALRASLALLKTALKGIVIFALLDVVMQLIDGFTSLVSSINDTSKAQAELDRQLKSLVATMERQRSVLTRDWYRGLISDSEYLAKLYKQENELMAEQIRLLNSRQKAYHSGEERGISLLWNWDRNESNYINDYMDKSTAEIEKKLNEFKTRLEKGQGFWSNLFKFDTGWANTVEDMEQRVKALSEIRLTQFINQIQDVNKAFNSGEITAEQMQKKVRDLYDQMNDDKVLRGIIANLDDIIPDDGVRTAINNIISDLGRLKDEFADVNDASNTFWRQVRIDVMDDGVSKIREQNKLDREKELSEYGKTQEQRNLINKKYDKELQRQIDDFNQKRKDKANEAAKKLAQAETDLQNLRIQNMRDGIDKQKAMLDQEEKERLRQIRENGVKVAELTNEVTKLYITKRKQLLEQWAKDEANIYRDLWESIFAIAHNSSQMETDSIEKYYEDVMAKQEEAKKKLASDTFGYDRSWDKLLSTRKQPQLFSDEELESAKKYTDLIQDLRIQENELYRLEMMMANDSSNQLLKSRYEGLKGQMEATRKSIADLIQEYGVASESLDEFQGTTEEYIDKYIKSLEKAMDSQLDFLKATNYSKDLSTNFKANLAELGNFNREYLKTTLNALEETHKARLKQLKDDRNAELRAIERLRDDELDKQEDALKKGYITQEQYNEMNLRLIEEYHRQYAAIEEKFEIEGVAENTKYNQQRREAYQTANNNIIDELKEFSDRLSEVQTSMPVADNALELVNYSKTKKRNDETIKLYQEMAQKILLMKRDLIKQLNEGTIEFADYKEAMKSLDELENGAHQSMKQIKLDTRDALEQLMSQISNYVQYIGQNLQNVLSWVADYEDALYQKRIEQLEKYIDEYQEKLDKQEEMTREYANNVKDIESDLSTARGDRRQELIDQLNSQMAAQRESLHQEQEYQKELDRLEKVKQKEEEKQAKREKQRKLNQAIISGALAVANALATTPFIPVGVAMGGLAAALTAVQIALIKKTPYANGGLLQGPSHSRGGIPVGNTGIEVEGNEFVINKKTTMKNLDLIKFINSRKHKLDLGELIDFYAGNSKSIHSNVTSGTRKFADGGTLPSLRSDINVTNRLEESFRLYAEKPTIVTVKDINDVQDKVNKVRVLSGLKSR